MKSAFGGCHALVIFIWFAAVITLSVVLMDPACLAVSVLCSAATLAKLRGAGALRKTLVFLAPAMIFAALINCLFNHAGVTPIAYFPGGNALTLESIAYGAAAAAMIAAAVLWCGCLSAVMTADKLICLFGRALPSLGMLVSMTLRFVPRFASQLRAVAEAQEGAGIGSGGVRAIEKGKRAMRILSITSTWALESSAQTADSMKSRGWGLSGRTSYTPLRFDRRDALLMTITCCLEAYTAFSMLAGNFYWHYFPYTGGTTSGAGFVFSVCAYLALCAVPLITDISEDAKWKRLEQKV